MFSWLDGNFYPKNTFDMMCCIQTDATLVTPVDVLWSDGTTDLAWYIVDQRRRFVPGEL
jgi:hypothetical protein